MSLLTWKSASPYATGEALAWIIPNLQEPKNKREIKRAARDLKDYKIDASADQIAKALDGGCLTELDDETWEGIVNSSSFKMEKLRDVLQMAKEQQKKVRHIIAEFIDSKVSAPIVLCIPGETEDDDRYFLVNGNTRLSVCKVFNIRPKVWIADLKTKEGGKSLLAAPFRTKGLKPLPTGAPIEKVLTHYFRLQEQEVLDWIQHPERWEKALPTQDLEVLNPDQVVIDKSLWMILPAVMIALRHWTRRMAESIKPIIHDYVYESAAETWHRLFPQQPFPKIPPIAPAVLDDIPPDLTTPIPERPPKPEPHTPAHEPITPPPITQEPIAPPGVPAQPPQIFRPPAEPVPETQPATPPKPPEKPPEQPTGTGPEKPRPSVSVDFSVVNPHLDKAIDSLPLKFCDETNETTSKNLQDALDQLRQELKEGMIKEGDGVRELTRRVKNVFEDAETWRAKRIAQTESCRAVHIAQLISAKQSGIVRGKKWILSEDACELCQAIATDFPNGIPLDASFATAESKFPQYRDIQHPPRHPNCRCALYEVLDESQLEPGRVIH